MIRSIAHNDDTNLPHGCSEGRQNKNVYSCGGTRYPHHTCSMLAAQQCCQHAASEVITVNEYKHVTQGELSKGHVQTLKFQKPCPWYTDTVCMCPGNNMHTSDTTATFIGPCSASG